MTPKNHTDACQTLFINTDKKLIPTLPRMLFEGRIVTVCGEAEAKRAAWHFGTARQFESVQTQLPVHLATKIRFPPR